MHLVDDHKLQMLEEFRPASVMGQNSGVQHVGIGDNQVSVLANSEAVTGGGVAIVGGDLTAADRPLTSEGSGQMT